MRHWDYDEHEEFQEEIDNFLDNITRENSAMLDDPRFQESENYLLEHAVQVAKGSWFWRFYSNETKLEKIAEVYDGLRKLLGV